MSIKLKAQSQKLALLLYPLTSSFQLCAEIGGGERDRTDDLLVANQVLSQLSYTPKGLPICAYCLAIDG